MDIKINDLYRALLQQCWTDVVESESSMRGRLIVDFFNFVASDAAVEGAKFVGEPLRLQTIDPWDEVWVLPELARATLEALTAWQSAARTMLERLHDVGETETITELRRRLLEVLGNPTLEREEPYELLWQVAAKPVLERLHDVGETETITELGRLLEVLGNPTLEREESHELPWQVAAKPVLERLHDVGETETITELRRLLKVIKESYIERGTV